jgi:uncharacterized protein (TIGR02117 family)
MNKKRILKILRYLGFSILGLIGLIVLYFLSAYILSSIGTNPPKVACETKIKAFLSSNDVHVDLILPISELDSNFINSLNPLEGAKYAAFGWGDRGFYLETPSWEDLKYSTVLKALFLNSPAVMHVSFYSNAHPSWVGFDFCSGQIKDMEAEIKKSFRSGKEDPPERIYGFDYGRNDRFFEAKGSYNCFRTCNVWTGNILKKGKIKTAIWSPFTGGIMYFAGK